jgi:flagellar hook protein FlgE
MPAKRTSEIGYKLNLPLTPKTGRYDRDVPGSEYLSPELNKNITAADVGPFLGQTLSGGSLPIHDAGGGKLDLEFRWGKLSGAPNPDKWALFYLRDQGAADGQTMWSKAGEYEFAGSQLSAVRDAADAESPLDSLVIEDLTVKGEVIGPVRLLHGPSGVTQFADARGQPVPTTLTQDGYSRGEHTGISIGPEGQVMQAFSNGINVEVAKIQLYNFANPEGLERGDGGELLYNTTAGQPTDIAADDLVTGALEGSNIDLPHEFSMLILTQQAYSASTRMISAADEMMKGALDEMR